MVIKMPENIKPTDPIYSQLKTYYRYGIQIRRITANSLRDRSRPSGRRYQADSDGNGPQRSQDHGGLYCKADWVEY